MKPLSSARRHSHTYTPFPIKSPSLRRNFLPMLDIRQDAQMRKVFGLARNRSRLVETQTQTWVRTAARVTLLLHLLSPGVSSASRTAEQRTHRWETSTQDSDTEFNHCPVYRTDIGPLVARISCFDWIGLVRGIWYTYSLGRCRKHRE